MPDAAASFLTECDTVDLWVVMGLSHCFNVFITVIVAGKRTMSNTVCHLLKKQHGLSSHDN